MKSLNTHGTIMSDLKEEYTRALGLRRLTEQEKTLRLLQNANCDHHGEKDLKKMSDKSTRKARPGSGVKPPFSPFFSNWKLAKKPKASRNFSSKSPRKKRDDAAATSTVVTTSPPPLQQQAGQNVLLLPKQNSPQQSAAVQPNIVVGQTIFQTPDGKKFILIPHNIAKPNTPGLVPVSKAPSQGQAPILPFASNIRIQSSKDADKTPQRFIYLPQSHSALGAAGGVSCPSVAVGNTVCTSVITSDTSQKNLDVDRQKHIGTEPIAQSNISPNIIHLLNMTRNMLSETKDPCTVVTMNSAIAQVPDVSSRLSPAVSIVSASSVNLVSVNPVASRSVVNMVPACSIVPVSSVVPAGSVVPPRSVVPANSLIPVISSNLRPWSHPGLQSNQPVQVLKIRHSQTSQSASSYAQQTQAPSTVFLESKSVSATNLMSNQESTPVQSLSLVSEAVPNQVSGGVPLTGVHDTQIGVISVAGSKMASNASMVAAVSPSSTAAGWNGVNAIAPIVPAVSPQSSGENPLKILEDSIASAIDGQNALITGIAVKNSMDSSTKGSANDGKRPPNDFVDPDRTLRNAETNSMVIIGKRRKKTLRNRGVCTLGHRRYGGPPFVPCKAPPTPYTPSSSTCCLYEYTLLKMATRGFWGCEMGKLQDVFRSIRCESVDQDTVEDVTKRCYEFVQARLIEVGDDCKSMYRYMKNYIDEFDSFLDRVYPVAIIAMLIYLPTAADYSLVTWHGIPPTGWSEYRRAVVMREVFEVIYLFWNELGRVPDYKKEYFECPNTSSLLVPRVFDLRQSFSDPTTCVVHKVPHGERVDSENKSLETVNGSNVDIKHSKGYSEEEELENDHMSSRTSPCEEFEGKEGKSCEGCPAEELIERPKLNTKDFDLSVHEEDAKNLALVGDRLPNTDELSLCSKNSNETLDSASDVLVTVRPRGSESPTTLNLSYSKGSSPVDMEFDKEPDRVYCRKTKRMVVEKPEVPISNGISDLPGKVLMSDVKKSELTIANEVWSKELTSKAKHNKFSFDSEAQGSLEVYSKDGVDLHEGIARKPSAKKVISAQFAESIAAACGNSHHSFSWNENARNEDHGEACTRTARDGTGSIVSASTTTATSTSRMCTHAVNDTLHKSATTRISVQESSQISVQPYSPQDTASKVKGNHHGFKDLRDYESASQRRRTPRRLASSARFDLLVATDDVSLKRDIRKAIKLSKLEKAVATPNHASEEVHVSEEANDFKKSDRPPLKTALNRLENVCSDEKCIPLESPISKLKKLKRSVAFEAMWTQKSVEEPTVIDEDKVYSLGQYLENFPVETHCPAEKTIIRICSEDYNAREILGYLRRGTQLVEQVGKDVVIDTTRTVKSNSTILAVRKVPPGKISKLVHPSLHLENYTSYLLPLGIKQPLKGRKGPGRSTRAKRKSSITKEEVTIKTEPQSPSVSSPLLSLNSFEDSIASPPPEKTIRLENSVGEEFSMKTDSSMEIVAQGSRSKESKETQTTDQNGNFVSSLAALSNMGCINSLEETLSTLMEASFSGLADSFVETNSASKDFFDNLIMSYERAGNFLLNTAKMLDKLKSKTLHKVSDS